MLPFVLLFNGLLGKEGFRRCRNARRQNRTRQQPVDSTDSEFVSGCGLEKTGKAQSGLLRDGQRAVWPGVEASVFAVGQLWLRSGDRACAGCCPGLSLGFGAQKTTDMNRCRMLVQCGNVGAAFRIGCERAFGMRVNAGCR